MAIMRVFRLRVPAWQPRRMPHFRRWRLDRQAGNDNLIQWQRSPEGVAAYALARRIIERQKQLYRDVMEIGDGGGTEQA